MGGTSVLSTRYRTNHTRISSIPTSNAIKMTEVFQTRDGVAIAEGEELVLTDADFSEVKSLLRG